MTLYDEALQAMNDLQRETAEMDTGRQPSAPTVIRTLCKLCQLHMQMAEQRSKHYNAWRYAEHKRKRLVAEKVKANRKADMTVKDAETAAFLDCGEEFNAEIEAETEYKQLQMFADSVRNGIDVGRTIQSYVKQSESHQPQ